MAWCKDFPAIFDDIEEGQFSLGWLSQNQTGKLASQQINKLTQNKENKLVDKDR